MGVKSGIVLLTIASLASLPSPSSIAADSLSEGRRLLSAGDAVHAAVCFQKAIDRNPKDANNHYLLGCAYASLNQLSFAQREFQTCLKLDPGGLSAQYSRSWLERLPAQSAAKAPDLADRLESLKRLSSQTQVPQHSPSLDRAQTQAKGLPVEAAIKRLDEAEAIQRTPGNHQHNQTFDEEMSAQLKTMPRSTNGVPMGTSSATSTAGVRTYETFDEPSGNPVPLIAQPKMLSLPGAPKN